jgi:hypothetical protein
MKPYLCLCAAATFVVLSLGNQISAAETRSIAGEWRVRLDPNRVGERERWFERALPGAAAISLPGSIDESRLAGPNPAKPTLDGLFRVSPYEGPVWFEYQLLIPGSWRGKRVSVVLERVHWETRVWIDGHEVPGTQDSLIAPHVHDLGPLGAPGTRRLTIRVDNTRKLDLGSFVSILYEGTQTNWNGMIGALEIRGVDPVAIDDVQVYPDLERKVARVRVRLSNTTGKSVEARLKLTTKGLHDTIVLAHDQSTTRFDRDSEVVRELALGPDLKLWDEFAPNLYLLSASVTAGGEGRTYSDERDLRFGMRRFAAEGTRFTLNGRPVFLRGTLECAIFPRTGYPPTSVGQWRRIYQTAKAYGLNFMRFHSWCPPDAAFAAADLEGVILQPEGPQANIDAGADPVRDAFTEAELVRMIRSYGNHPSFCLMTLGNEYGGDDRTLSRWINMLRDADPRHLYSSPSAGQPTANRQFTEGGPRGVWGPGTDRDFRAEVARQDRPLTGHEIGQWTFFPNFEEIGKYDGVLAAKNFELVREDMRAKRLLPLAPRFVRATGLHASLLYKEEIEVLLRTPKYAGFSLLDLHDYPGQGTALVGLLDPFWDSKGFVTPDGHRRYCGPTVPLLRMPRRTYSTTESFVGRAELAHFGPGPLADIHPIWSIRDQKGRTVASGSLETRTVPTGELTELGTVQVSLEKAAAPCKLTVTLALGGTEFANAWEIWVYPPGSNPLAIASDACLITREWDESTRTALRSGKAVLLFPRVLSAKRSLPGRFLPVFWSPIWFPKQQPNTMGILCDPGHPALSLFPTDDHSNWQWYELLEHSRSVILDDSLESLQPIVQVIDNFARNHKLANLFETRVGPGRLLVCTINLPRLGESQAARQLFQSLLAYAESKKFRPACELGLDRLNALFERSQSEVMQKLGARIAGTDSQQLEYEAGNLLDGDPSTIWHTRFGRQVDPFPHEVVISFDSPGHVAGVRVLPRQDQTGGRIKNYRIELSADGRTWSLAARGAFDRSENEKTVSFKAQASCRFLKLVAESAFDDQPFASLAELSVIEAKTP